MRLDFTLASGLDLAPSRLAPRLYRISVRKDYTRAWIPAFVLGIADRQTRYADDRQARYAGDPNKAQGEAECRSGARHVAKPWVTVPKLSEPAQRVIETECDNRCAPGLGVVERPLRGLPFLVLANPGFRAPAKRDRSTLGFIRVARLAGLEFAHPDFALKPDAAASPEPTGKRHA